MSNTVIINAGRVGDRTDGLISGAIRSGQRFADAVHAHTETVGNPSQAQTDNWDNALEEARPTLDALASTVARNLDAGNFIGIFSSTCSSGLASMPQVAKAFDRLHVIYVDGHGDFNIPSETQTGYLGGMVLSGVCGLWDSGYGSGVDPTRVTLVGSRDLDPEEIPLLQRNQVSVFPEMDVPQILKSLNGEPVWIHIDWDSLAPGYVPADYTVPGGLTPQQIKELIAGVVASKSQLVGFEVSEFLATENASPTADEALETLMDIMAPLKHFWEERHA